MASAQVLPSARKQEHLAAGKRRLEEFRKKKAADKAKKSSPSNSAGVTQSVKQPSDSQLTLPANSDGAIQPPSLSEINGGAFDNFERSKQDSQFPINDTPDAFPGSSSHMHSKDEDYNKNYEFSNGSVNYSINQETAETKGDYGLSGGSYYGSTSDHDSKGNEETLGRENSSNSIDFSFKNTESSLNLGTDNTSSQRFTSYHQQTKFTNASTHPWGDISLSFKQETIQPSSMKEFSPESGGAMLDVAVSDGSEKPNIDERRPSNSSGGFPGIQNLAPYTSSQYSSTSYDADYSNSSDLTSLYPLITEAQPRRSRPSFLDSLNVPRPSPGLPYKDAESRESISGNDTKIHVDSLSPASFGGTQYVDKLTTSASGISNGEHLPAAGEHSAEKKSEFYLPKQDEDFSALEQHIEDLTQEKFSLQRALEASRALAESLASENSSLTDSYNQQRGAVNQLKADMENLQEEISTQLAELESLKHEYANAQLECNAADERAKLLASEVIGLEEKALRLRSSELKLERQLEKSQAEISAYKKKVSNLEKDRQDLQSTISALQEEKKVLQSKLRKSSGGKSIEVSQSSASKKDTSTSTDDLDGSVYTSPQQMEQSRSVAGNDASSSLSTSDTLQLNLEASFAYIPPDQLRVVDSINTIISELALEKEELVKALASETSDNSKLKRTASVRLHIQNNALRQTDQPNKDLNKELSRKLEAQTQRLELLTAQSMANDGTPAKHPDPRTVLANTPYADEGDEVVERVLGWIMKLFPGGPAKRRTSKLL